MWRMDAIQRREWDPVPASRTSPKEGGRLPSPPFSLSDWRNDGDDDGGGGGGRWRQPRSACCLKARHASKGSRRLADVTREEEAAAAVGGAIRKRKWCVLCHVFYPTVLGEATSRC